jgi:hypothetical protein
MTKKLNTAISILSLLIIILFGCEKNKEMETNEKSQQEVTLKNLEWVIGTWKRETSHGIMYENWKMINDTLMKGKVYRLMEADTVVMEQLSLEIIDGDIFYVPVVPHNKGAVYFKLIEQPGDKSIFENPEHDFPQRIIYSKISGDSLHARIEGMNKGIESGRDFYFKRIE